MKSLYVVFPEAGKVEVREETLGAPGSGEILCVAEKSLVSTGTETFCLQGVFDPGTNWLDWVQYPFRPGYSMAARIAAVGKGVKGMKEGDRIACWRSHDGAFIADPANVYPVPDGVSAEEATWNCLATTTQVAVRRAGHVLGETVGVVGMGQLGQLVVQYLLLSGARKVIALDAVQSRLDMAKAHGATHVLNVNVKDARKPIEDLTDGKMLDVVYDVTGHYSVLAHCIALVRRLGRVVLLGDTPTPTRQNLAPGVVSNSVAILGIHGTTTPDVASDFNPWTRGEVISLFFDYLMRGRMKVSDLVTDRYSPVDAPKVYDRLLKDRSSVMGIVFDWSKV